MEKESNNNGINDMIEGFIQKNVPDMKGKTNDALFLLISEKLEQLFWILAVENFDATGHDEIEKKLQEEGKQKAMEYVIEKKPELLDIWEVESKKLLEKHSQ